MVINNELMYSRYCYYVFVSNTKNMKIEYSNCFKKIFVDIFVIFLCKSYFFNPLNIFDKYGMWSKTTKFMKQLERNVSP